MSERGTNRERGIRVAVVRKIVEFLNETGTGETKLRAIRALADETAEVCSPGRDADDQAVASAEADSVVRLCRSRSWDATAEKVLTWMSANLAAVADAAEPAEQTGPAEPVTTDPGGVDTNEPVTGGDGGPGDEGKVEPDEGGTSTNEPEKGGESGPDEGGNVDPEPTEAAGGGEPAGGDAQEADDAAGTRARRRGK